MPPTWIITGTGKCGTHYAAALINALGHPAGHEAHVDAYGTEHPIGRQQGEVGWPILPYAHKYDCPKVTLVRDPFRTTHSIFHTLRRHKDARDAFWYRHFAAHYHPTAPPGDPLAAAVEYVHKMLAASLQTAPAIARIESLDNTTTINNLLRALELPPAASKDVRAAVHVATLSRHSKWHALPLAPFTALVQQLDNEDSAALTRYAAELYG